MGSDSIDFKGNKKMGVAFSPFTPMKNSFLLCALLFVCKNLLAQEHCPAMAGFAELQEKIKTANAEKSITLLNKYLNETDLVATCQAEKIEALFDQIEKPNFSLVKSMGSDSIDFEKKI
jgi:hypothetical protein